MREILFRGKLAYTGEWVEGYYEFGYDSENGEPTHYMWVLDHKEKYGEMFIVIPETVGQFTGLTDKNGKRIFEGDILKQAQHLGIVTANIHNCGCCHSVYGFSVCDKNGEPNDSIGFGFSEEVIGNIHDNPELLER